MLSTWPLIVIPAQLSPYITHITASHMLTPHTKRDVSGENVCTTVKPWIGITQLFNFAIKIYTMFQPMFYDLFLLRFKTLIYSFQFVMVKSVGLSQLLPQNMQSVSLILQPGPHLHSRKPPNYTIKWQTARKFLTIGKRISPLIFVTTLSNVSIWGWHLWPGANLLQALPPARPLVHCIPEPSAQDALHRSSQHTSHPA